MSLERGPASPPAPSLAVEDENLVCANFDDLGRLQDIVVPGAPVVPKVLDHGILAADDQRRMVGKEPSPRGVHLDFFVEQVEEAAWISFSVHAPYQLDVLLRHRLRSISRTGVAFVPSSYLGLAILSSVSTSRITSAPNSGSPLPVALTHGFKGAFVVAAVLCSIGLAVAVVFLPGQLLLLVQTGGLDSEGVACRYVHRGDSLFRRCWVWRRIAEPGSPQPSGRAGQRGCGLRNQDRWVRWSRLASGCNGGWSVRRLWKRT